MPSLKIFSTEFKLERKEEEGRQFHFEILLFSLNVSRNEKA